MRHGALWHTRTQGPQLIRINAPTLHLRKNDLAANVAAKSHAAHPKDGSSQSGGTTMSLGTILLILLVIFLLGGFSGRFGGYGYGFG